ncbi:LamG domain-containing protein [Candidatus Poribacteria bacterium]|nr:LamG domain-containing protein [Candidatus Poribacteria bacterium]
MNLLHELYKGLIDEVKVWNRPLTAEELEQSGKQPSAVSASGKLTTVWGVLKTAHR